jgi:hypothetical protein
MPQSNWRNCGKCTGAFFAGSPSTGACPAGGGHDYNIFGGGTDIFPKYTLQTNDPGAPGQSNWRWCSKCQGLFFAGTGLFYAGTRTSGTCPAGGGHDSSGSADYTLNNTGVITVPSDDFYRWCRKCKVLFRLPQSDIPFPCPAAGNHDASQSSSYALPVVFDKG